MRVTIIGTGYVGLVTGACLSESGATVHCIDIDEAKINQLKKGVMPIYEPGLEGLVKNTMAKGRLNFGTRLEQVLNDSDIVVIAVGTPPSEDNSADLSYLESVAHEIGLHLSQYAVIVTKSTVPVGTASRIKSIIENGLRKRNIHIPFDVASNPEFLKEGNAIEDFMKPDRIVIGSESSRARKILARLYKPFVLNNHPIIYMDVSSSELTKYTANALLATKISFINDIANLCEKVGANIDAVRKGIGTDARIGDKFLYPGAGYGGSCFPKDVKALIKTGTDVRYKLRILQAVEEINRDQKNILFDKINAAFKGKLKGKTVGLWGLAFKPGTNDMREAPSLNLIRKLLEKGVHVKAYDPVAMDEARRILGGSVEFVDDMYEACITSHALAVVTEWNEFRLPNYRVLTKLMSRKLIFDGRNIFYPEEVSEHGFEYHGIGRQAPEIENHQVYDLKKESLKHTA